MNQKVHIPVLLARQKLLQHLSDAPVRELQSLSEEMNSIDER
jgi:hypothetical protein